MNTATSEIRAYAANPEDCYRPFKDFRLSLLYLLTRQFSSQQQYPWGENQSSNEWIEAEAFRKQYKPDRGSSYLQYYQKKAHIPLNRSSGRGLLPLHAVHDLCVAPKDYPYPDMLERYRIGYHGEMAVVEAVSQWLYRYPGTSFHYSGFPDDYWHGGIDAWFCRSQGNVMEAFALDICTAPAEGKVFKHKVKKSYKRFVDQTVYLNGEQQSYQTGCRVIPLFVPEKYQAAILDAVKRDYSFTDRSIMQPWEIITYNEQLSRRYEELRTLQAPFLRAVYDYEVMVHPQVLDFEFAL